MILKGRKRQTASVIPKAGIYPVLLSKLDWVGNLKVYPITISALNWRGTPLTRFSIVQEDRAMLVKNIFLHHLPEEFFVKKFSLNRILNKDKLRHYLRWI